MLKTISKQGHRMPARAIVLLLLLLAPLTSQAASSDFVHATGTSLNLGLSKFTPRGVNLMDHDTIWYPDRTLPTDKWFTAKEFASLKKDGFNSIRLVVKTDYFQDPKPPHAFSERGFAWLDRIVKLAKKNGLRLIIDMHMPTGGYQQDYQINDNTKLFWGDDWMKGRFVDVWRELARRYKDEPTIWAYDLMNEPATTDFTAYQKLISATVNAIRSNDHNHLLLAQKGMYIRADQSWGMQYPELQDMNVAYGVHFYQPTDFTLQGAAWLPSTTTLVTYPSPSSTPTYGLPLMKSWLSPTEGTSTARPFVLTEFGTLFPKRLSGQPVWITDVAKAAGELGMGWHYWHLTGETCKNAFALKTRYSVCRPITYGLLSGLAKQ